MTNGKGLIKATESFWNPSKPEQLLQLTKAHASTTSYERMSVCGTAACLLLGEPLELLAGNR